MSNRKLQITIFAAFAAFGLAFGPAAAVAKNGEQHSNSNGAHNSSNWGHKGSKWGSGGPRHDKISMNGNGGKHDKHDKHGKHDKWDKHDKWKHAHHHHKWHHKKHYYEQPTTYTYVKPVYTTPSYSYNKPTYAYSPPPNNPCTCLTKEYDSDGDVVFKDLCTKEMAVYSKGDEKD